MRIAITREVSPAIDQCELTHVPRAGIDLFRAREQHAQYERALAELGCRIERLPASDEYPDSVFVEDVAVVLDEVAVITRPGTLKRRGETELIKPALAPYRLLEEIVDPGTLDGGDVLQSGRTVYVGKSLRSNASGIGQLGEILSPFGYGVVGVELAGCLHLKTAATLVAEDTVLLNPEMVDPKAFGGLRHITVAPLEPMGANALLVGDRVIYPTAFPQTRKRLSEGGIDVVDVDADELAKAEGGVTCCSLILEEA